MADRSRLLNSAMVSLPLLLFIAVATYALWRTRSVYFVTIPAFQYVANVWGILTALVALIPIIAATIRIAQALTTGKAPAKKREISIDHAVVTTIRAVTNPLRRPMVSVVTALLLVGAGAALPYVISLPEKSPAVSSSVVVINRGTEKFIYVADPERGQVLVFRSSDLANPATAIPIGSQGNQPGRGRPESMIAFHRSGFLKEELDLLFVTDTAPGADKVHIIDVRYGTEIGSGLPVGKAPRSLVITPDHRRLFVSNEQPIPNGSISVIDLNADNPNDFHKASTIEGINCPQGLALSPRGDRLYVATQCGGDRDPVLIVDTATNEKVGAIPGLAVGTKVIASPDSPYIYVSRGNFPCARPDSSEPGSPFSVANLDTREVISTVCLRTSVGAIGLSRDTKQRYLFVANGNRLSVFDREKVPDKRKITSPEALLNDIPLEAAVTGIGIADDNSVYAYVPDPRPDARPPRRKLFIYTPTGLKPDA